MFAGPIFVIVGLNASAMGLAVRRLHIRRGLVNPSAFDRLDRFFSLENILCVATAAVVAGIAIDFFIFFRWVGDAEAHPVGPQLAALAQTLIVAGTNAGLIGFLTASYET